MTEWLQDVVRALLGLAGEGIGALFALVAPMLPAVAGLAVFVYLLNMLFGDDSPPRDGKRTGGGRS